MEILNRKARHDYFIEEEYECGIVLTGTEIKSIRDELFLLNTFISHYKEGNIFNHNETRTRKLLMHKKEILKLNDKITLQGYTLIPLKVYFKNNKAKMLLGLCKGKKNYDKRESLKERDIKRQLDKDSKAKYV